MRDEIVRAAHSIRDGRYADAAVVFAAGSLVRGEGTAYSDLDLVVIYAQLPCAYREAFRFDGVPVEAFVHDPETLNYFFLEVERPSGMATLANMVVDGVEIPLQSSLSRSLKERAAALLASGPPELAGAERERLRYFVTDLVDDLRDPRTRQELVGTGSQLFEVLANYHLRRSGLWSARGKSIPRTLARVDPGMSSRFSEAFDDLFIRGDAATVIALADDILRADGGWLFDGYRSNANPTWRKSLASTISSEAKAPTGDCISLEVRHASETDVDAISTLTGEVQRVHRALLPALFRPSEPAAFIEHMRQVLTDSASLVLVACAGENVVGYVYAEVRHRSESVYRYAADDIHVHHISVKPDCRREGVGRRLLQAVDEVARGRGIAKVTLEVWGVNASARTFFETCGFRPFVERLEHSVS